LIVYESRIIVLGHIIGIIIGTSKNHALFPFQWNVWYNSTVM